MSKVKASILFVFILLGLTAHGQMKITRGDTIICNVGDASHISSGGSSPYVGSKSSPFVAGRTQANTNFEVKYSGFPVAAQAAVQKAIDIWSVHLKSSVKVVIFASWVDLSTTTPNTLAYVVPTQVANFPGAPVPNVTYPMTLAEKLAQTDLNATTEADIVATFNSGRTDWNLETNGVPVAGKFDLVTIALHELGHGLGFSGTFFANETTGQYGPTKIYDTYIQKGVGGNLIVNNSAYPNPSEDLRQAIISGDLFFKSPLAQQFNSSAYPRLYAPNPYNGGSSISHLDEGTYPTGNINSLLTPFVNPAEVNHRPGPLLKGIFYEMGWLYTYLKHTDITDKESMTGVTFDLDVKSDTTLNTTSGRLYYSYDGFATSANLPLTLVSGTKWSASLASPPTEKTISYYFTFTDIFNRVYRYPQNTSSYASFYYGVDTKKPQITHTALTDIVEFKRIIPITATVTDNIGLQKVEVEYQVNSGAIKKVTLANTSGSIYSGQIDLTPDNIKGGDIVKYRIVATDNSSQSNVAYLPASGMNQFNVKLFAVQTLYTTDFATDKLEFYGDFSISTPVGFTNGALHTPHPYPRSGTSTPVDITHLLLYPIKVKSQDSYIQFDEVVLVEPVNDYVIVEGSKDNGNTWKQLVPAYDIRKNDAWLTYYNSASTTGGTNQAIGTLNYYRSSRIDMLSSFAAGDEIFIRFRLNSNNTINAWGWAIDNLRINDAVTAVDDPFSTPTSIIAYPNPVSAQLKIESEIKIFSATAYSMTGQMINLAIADNQLDVTSLAGGVYVIRLKFENGSTQMTKIVKR